MKPRAKTPKCNYELAEIVRLNTAYALSIGTYLGYVVSYNVKIDLSYLFLRLFYDLLSHP